MQSDQAARILAREVIRLDGTTGSLGAPVFEQTLDLARAVVGELPTTTDERPLRAIVISAKQAETIKTLLASNPSEQALAMFDALAHELADPTPSFGPITRRELAVLANATSIKQGECDRMTGDLIDAMNALDADIAELQIIDRQRVAELHGVHVG